MLAKKNHGKIAERPNATDCKSVVSDFGGSNPPLPTKVNPQGFIFFILNYYFNYILKYYLLHAYIYYHIIKIEINIGVNLFQKKIIICDGINHNYFIIIFIFKNKYNLS